MADIYTKLGNACATFRKERGLTQAAVAYDCGYTQGNVSAFERGYSGSIGLLLWYIRQGFDVSAFMKEADNGA